MSNDAPAMAYRLSDGGLQWKTPKLPNFGQASAGAVRAGDTICFSGSACGSSIDGKCYAEVQCVSSATGEAVWKLPPSLETVGGAAIEVTPLLSDTPALLLVNAMDESPGQHAVEDESTRNIAVVNEGSADHVSGGGKESAWVAEVTPSTGNAVFNFTYGPKDAVKTTLLLDDGGVFVVVGPGPNGGPRCLPALALCPRARLVRRCCRVHN